MCVSSWWTRNIMHTHRAPSDELNDAVAALEPRMKRHMLRGSRYKRTRDIRFRFCHRDGSGAVHILHHAFFFFLFSLRRPTGGRLQLARLAGHGPRPALWRNLPAVSPLDAGWLADESRGLPCHVVEHSPPTIGTCDARGLVLDRCKAICEGCDEHFCHRRNECLPGLRRAPARYFFTPHAKMVTYR